MGKKAYMSDLRYRRIRSQSEMMNILGAEDPRTDQKQIRCKLICFSPLPKIPQSD